MRLLGVCVHDKDAKDYRPPIYLRSLVDAVRLADRIYQTDNMVRDYADSFDLVYCGHYDTDTGRVDLDDDSLIKMAVGDVVVQFGGLRDRLKSQLADAAKPPSEDVARKGAN